jgi:hypothetical protein
VPEESGEFSLSLKRIRAMRDYQAAENSKIVIPKAGFARGICFFLRFAKKPIPRCARDDN